MHRGRREDDAERWVSHPKEIRGREEKKKKRKKVVLRSPHENLPTQDHDKITLQNPPRKDHIAFVRSTRAIWPSVRSRFPFLYKTWLAFKWNEITGDRHLAFRTHFRSNWRAWLRGKPYVLFRSRIWCVFVIEKKHEDFLIWTCVRFLNPYLCWKWNCIFVKSV